MNLSDAAFLADENIHPDVCAYLKLRASDVVEVKGTGLAGTDELTLLERAFAENRIILTHDADFGTLAIASGRPVFGIIYLRPGHILPSFTIGSLQTLFEQAPDVSVPFLIVVKRSGENVTIRVRSL